MSESPVAKSRGLVRGKVAGIPIIYLAGGVTVILVVFAYRTHTAKAAVTASADATTNADGSIAQTTAVPPVVPSVGDSGSPPVADSSAPVPYEDNQTWLRKAAGWLIASGKNPGDVQIALQNYLEGGSLSYNQGQLRDAAVRQFGLPPDSFDAGATSAAPVPPVNVPKPVPPVNTPVAHPMPKPVPPPVKSYIVRPGDTLSGIGAKFHVSWEAIYAKNKNVIGSNPNLIKPGTRLVIP